LSEFGARFKKAREARGVTLDQIASDTRISTRFLAAIENEDFGVLPGGIFNRGFIRAYAERVGLDPQQAIRDYEQLARAAEPEHAPPETAPVERPRQLYPVALGALVLLIAIFYVVSNRGESPSETDSPALETPAPIQETPTQSPPAPAPVDPLPPPVAATTAREAPRTIALELQVHEATWIKLSADGAPLVNGEILPPGTSRRFTAQSAIDLTIGNAGGLTLKLNDRQVRSLGRRGQVRSLMITPENVADIIG